MDWKQIFSLNLGDLNDLKRDEIYENIIYLKREHIDKKHYKKLIDLLQHILKYKGDMVNSLLTELETISVKGIPNINNVDLLLEENNQLKSSLDKLETDKIKLKSRIKELTDENSLLITNTATKRRSRTSVISSGNVAEQIEDMNSDGRDDSPDALSELDKKEELLGNIAQKNKHIKRLLRDIDELEKQTLNQIDQIKELQIHLTEATLSITQVTKQLSDYKYKLSNQNDVIEELNNKIISMHSQIIQFENDKKEREIEIGEFGKQLEQRAIMWRQMLEDKNERLESLRTKYEDILAKHPGYDIDTERIEIKRMADAIIERDELITELETKIVQLSREMMDSTEIMNQLANERELFIVEESKINNNGNGKSKTNDCCNEIKLLLDNSSKRCNELQEMLENIEEDNVIKSKQAMEAMDALNSFKTGQNGLTQVLKRSSELQNQLLARDKHIQSLIIDINSLQEITQENIILRKRLGLPDDEFISTKLFTAKQKKYEKINERLSLKLRASEEMRLQLKLEKNDLRRQLSKFINPIKNVIDSIEDSTNYDVKFCEQCLQQYNIKRNDDGIESDNQENLCDQCLQQFSRLKKTNGYSKLNMELKELENKYSLAVEENENLRIGMHEILEQLRNYDAESDNIVINTNTLECLLHALDARSISGWYHPAMRIQNELIAVKERELALKERVRISENNLIVPSTNLTKINTIVNNKEESSHNSNDDDEIIVNQLVDNEDTASNATFTLDNQIDKKELSPTQEIETASTLPLREQPLLTKSQPSPLEFKQQSPSSTTQITVNKPIPHPRNSLIQQIVDQEIQLEKYRTENQEITEQYRIILLNCDHLKIYEKQFNELINNLKFSSSQTSSIPQTNDESINIPEININNRSINFEISNNHEQILKLKLQINNYEKKCEFLTGDYQNLKESTRTSTIRLNNLIYELRRQQVHLENQLCEINDNNSVAVSINNNNEEISSIELDLDELKQELSFLKYQSSQHLGTILTNLQKQDDGTAFIGRQLTKIDYEKLQKIAMINTNLTVDFMTRAEFENIYNECKSLKLINVQDQQKIKNLEELLKICQEQLTSQQQTMSLQFEDEIALKHLIVDLQSENNEKYQIVKLNRELKRIQENEDLLKLENIRLIDEEKRMKQFVENSKQTINQYKQNLELLTSNNELKLKFLRKSFIELNENYNQFIPLYPLINFITDYGCVLEAKKEMDKLLMNLKLNQGQSIKDLNEKLDSLLNSNGHPSTTSLYDKILVIKYQSQIDSLEQHIELMTNKLMSVENENQQLKLNDKKYLQQWKTIELLFGNDIVGSSSKLKADIHNNDKTSSQYDKKFIGKETQTQMDIRDECTNTDIVFDEIIANVTKLNNNQLNESTNQSSSETNSIKANVTTDSSTTNTEPITLEKSMEYQLKQAMILASTRSTLLLETENHLVIAQGRIKMLERIIEDRDKEIRDERENKSKTTISSLPQQQNEDNILSTTIAALQNLLLEKDTTLSRYQDLLRTERETNSSTCDKHRIEIKSLRATVDELEIKIKTKDRELEALKVKLSDQKEKEIHDGISSTGGGAGGDFVSLIGSPAHSVHSKKLQIHHEIMSVGLVASAGGVGVTGGCIDNISTNNQFPDQFIEELFLDDHEVFDVDVVDELAELRKNIKNKGEEIKKLQIKLRDVSNREVGWEKSLTEKDKEIVLLNERLNKSDLNMNEIADNISTRREIDQLREMLEEKDRHITDLTNTLTHFHDDQQKFLNDTSIHSTEQVTQLSADLNRSEATNRILNTQLEALKRQLANVGQRELQARDIIKSLKNQLIRRPVISVKPPIPTERITTNREDTLQKRINQLDNELSITKEELRKQTHLAQTRRTKDAADLGLWNKQKRFQQMSDQLKTKLIERENELEKLKGHFGTAKNTINRLEREKHILESRISRLSGTSGGGGGCGTSGCTGAGHRICQSPSCPNLHTQKYTPAESPESYTTASDLIQHGSEYHLHHHSAATAVPISSTSSINQAATTSAVSSRCNKLGFIEISDNNQDIIDALKQRIESQQRRIVAMELEGRGSSAISIEFEKLQEKLSQMDAQNIRLEALNLHLQLDNEMLSHGDNSEKTKRRIQYLEDYIVALKNEMAQSNALSIGASANTSSTIQMDVQSTKSAGSLNHQQQMEQSILALRRVIERLKVENKQLKDGKIFSNKLSTKTSNGGGNVIAKKMYEKLKHEYEKVQQLYSDSLDKMSALKIELEIQNSTYSECKIRKDKFDDSKSGNRTNEDLMSELLSLKDKLIKKTQLLEKAKILLTRAAAKEKNFREQIIFWKHRCSELQNVPVIEEASE